MSIVWGMAEVIFDTVACANCSNSVLTAQATAVTAAAEEAASRLNKDHEF